MDAAPIVSAVVCTHNPCRSVFEKTLETLRYQSLASELWELIVVDNASGDGAVTEADASWHPRGRVVREAELGLTPARLRGAREADAALLVYIDDDNFLAPEYLFNAVELMQRHPEVGMAGGRCFPESEVIPPKHVAESSSILACRDLGDVPILGGWDMRPEGKRYPAFAPVGAGMVIRREVMDVYARQIESSGVRRSFDRRGPSLASAGDNDLVMTGLDEGWKAAYFPELALRHFIPARRMEREYLARLAEESHRTWVLALDLHGVRPWPPILSPALPLYCARYYLQERAWRDAASYIRWRSLCGQARGRAALK